MPYSPMLSFVRLFNVYYKCLKNHYDVLGISAKATQAEIKTAYYKLSMLYHPDRNQGSREAAEKFQDISTAYEILGNFQRRRLYDKGLLVDKKIQQPYSDTHQATYQRQRPSSTGRTPLYDFDEWARAHYGKSFARRNTAKREYKEESDAHSLRKRDQAMIILIITVLLILLVAAALESNLDEPRTGKAGSVGEEPTKKK